MRTALKAAAYESQHGGADIHGVRPQQGLGGGHHIINQQHTAALQGGQARQKLGAEAGRLQGIFITLDPARDTPEVLKAYVTSFDESFIALTPRSPQELAALAREFKIFYRQTPGPLENSYTLDHTAASYMYDPQGRLRLYQTYGIGADAMAANARALLHEKSAD